jgi:hypothetical protein
MCRFQDMGQGPSDDTMSTIGGGTAVADPVLTPRAPSPAPSTPVGPDAAVPVIGLPVVTGGSDALAVLDDPRLVLSESFIGVDRRRTGVRGTFGRASFGTRRRLLRLDVLIVLAVATSVVVAVLLVAGGTRPTRSAVPPAPTTAARAVTDHPAASAARPVPTTAPPPAAVTSATPTAPVATIPAATAPTAAAPAATPAPPAPVAATPPAPSTPEAMGTAALALVRYPWQQIPGYSIVFKSIADAPSPGFYGNTAFSWGSTGGTSTLYVYPGETVDQLAGITAFEIGHEVDAAYVEPLGGHAQIAGLLGVHPASWAPECDCGEQGYLSGWYAAAFSDYWSPGVGQWSTLAPEPSGALLTAMEPWLDPRTT